MLSERGRFLLPLSSFSPTRAFKGEEEENSSFLLSWTHVCARVREGRKEGNPPPVLPIRSLSSHLSLCLPPFWLLVVHFSPSTTRGREFFMPVFFAIKRERREWRGERVREIKISLFSAGLTHALMGAIWQKRFDLNNERRENTRSTTINAPD